MVLASIPKDVISLHRTSNLGFLPSFSIAAMYHTDIPVISDKSSRVSLAVSRDSLMICPNFAFEYITVNSPHIYFTQNYMKYK